MDWNEWKGLKYYIMYTIIILGFFVYSGLVGWRWFNPTQTTHEKSGTGGSRIHRGYYYHK